MLYLPCKKQFEHLQKHSFSRYINSILHHGSPQNRKKRLAKRTKFKIHFFRQPLFHTLCPSSKFFFHSLKLLFQETTQTFTKAYFYYINSILRWGSSQNRKKESWRRKPKSKFTFPNKHFPESLFTNQIFFSSPIFVLRENNSHIHINILLACYCIRWAEKKKKEKQKRKSSDPFPL